MTRSFRRSLWNETPLAGLAERLYEAFSGLIWEGGLGIIREECDTGLRPGMSVNVTGGQEAWESMEALVQSVSEDLMTGETSVEFGLPQFCGAKPILFTFTRRRHNDRDKDADAGGEERLETADDGVPPTGSLCGYVERLEDGSYVFGVSPGDVATGDPETPSIVPLWDSTSTPLDAATPPTVAIAPGASFSYWLYIEYSPITQEFNLLDDEGASFTEWRATPICQIEDADTTPECRIKFSTGSPSWRAVEVNSATGEVTTTGRVYFLLGSVAWPVGENLPTISPTRLGPVQPWFIPPGLIYLITP